MTPYLPLSASVSGPVPERPGAPSASAHRVAPPAQDRPPGARQADLALCDPTIERYVGWLKQCRRIATHYEKLAVNFEATVELAMIQRYLRLLVPSDRA